MSFVPLMNMHGEDGGGAEGPEGAFLLPLWVCGSAAEGAAATFPGRR